MIVLIFNFSIMFTLCIAIVAFFAMVGTSYYSIKKGEYSFRSYAAAMMFPSFLCDWLMFSLHLNLLCSMMLSLGILGISLFTIKKLVQKDKK